MNKFLKGSLLVSLTLLTSAVFAENIYISNQGGSPSADSIQQINPNTFESKTISLKRLGTYSHWPTELNTDHKGHVFGAYVGHPVSTSESFIVDLSKIDSDPDKAVSRVFFDLPNGAKEKYLQPTLFRVMYNDGHLAVSGGSTTEGFPVVIHDYNVPSMDKPIEHLHPLSEPMPAYFKSVRYAGEDSAGNNYIIHTFGNDGISKYTPDNHLVWNTDYKDYIMESRPPAFHDGKVYFIAKHVESQGVYKLGIYVADESGIHEVTMEDVVEPVGIAFVGDHTYVLDKVNYMGVLKKYDGITPSDKKPVDEKRLVGSATFMSMIAT